eukprot:1141923-Amphidinium_carterae.2
MSTRLTPSSTLLSTVYDGSTLSSRTWPSSLSPTLPKCTRNRSSSSNWTRLTLMQTVQLIVEQIAAMPMPQIVEKRPVGQIVEVLVPQPVEDLVQGGADGGHDCYF